MGIGVGEGRVFIGRWRLLKGRRRLFFDSVAVLDGVIQSFDIPVVPFVFIVVNTLDLNIPFPFNVWC